MHFLNKIYAPFYNCRSCVCETGGNFQRGQIPNILHFDPNITLTTKTRANNMGVQWWKGVIITIRFYIYCTCVCPHVIKLLVSQTVCPRNPRFCMLSCRVLETIDNNNMTKLVALTYIFFFRNVLAKLSFWHIGRPNLTHKQQNHLHFGSFEPVLKHEWLNAWPFCLIM